MSIMRAVLMGVVALVVLGAVWVFGSINTIPKQDEAANAAWAQVLSQYQRRADLVPNLVATVKAYAAHEEKVLMEVTNARARIGQLPMPDPTDPASVEKFQKAQGELSGALSRLLVVSEAYPDLKASENFLTLQSQLEGTENRIAVARKDYIEAVQAYNTTLVTFPGRLVAMLFYPGKEPRAQFTATAGSEAVPQVQF